MRRTCVHGSAKRQLLLLAPPGVTGLDNFENVIESPHTHGTLLASMQRLRGRIYVAEGAIPASSLTEDGRHAQDVDSRSWHLLSIGSFGQVLGCARFHPHSTSADFHNTGVSRSALACKKGWASRLRRAVEAEMSRARYEDRTFIEAGGWALSEDLRHSPEGIRIALGAFCWAKLIGGAVGVATATVRNKSAQILQRLGGAKLRADDLELPRYFDPAYGCDMEILRFSDDSYATACHDAVLQLTGELAKAAVITPRRPVWDYRRMLYPTLSRTPAVYA